MKRWIHAATTLEDSIDKIASILTRKLEGRDENRRYEYTYTDDRSYLAFPHEDQIILIEGDEFNKLPIDGDDDEIIDAIYDNDLYYILDTFDGEDLGFKEFKDRAKKLGFWKQYQEDYNIPD